jgi:Family of unknown function (DUF5309)
VATVDIIATDGGRVTAMPSRWLPIDMGLLLDPEYARLAFFRNFRQHSIAKIGDAETRLLVVEWGTQVDNGLAHIVFNGVTPTLTMAALGAQSAGDPLGARSAEDQRRLDQAVPPPQLEREKAKEPVARK